MHNFMLNLQQNQGAPNMVSNNFNVITDVEYDNEAKKEPAEGVINDLEYDSDHEAKKEPAENFVESTFFSNIYELLTDYKKGKRKLNLALKSLMSCIYNFLILTIFLSWMLFDTYL